MTINFTNFIRHGMIAAACAIPAIAGSQMAREITRATGVDSKIHLLMGGIMVGVAVANIAYQTNEPMPAFIGAAAAILLDEDEVSVAELIENVAMSGLTGAAVIPLNEAVL